MPDNRSPWKATAIGMALVMVTALITGLVVANWYGPEDAGKTATKDGAPATAKPAALETHQPAPAKAGPSAPGSHLAPSVPTPSAVEACNQHAAKQVSARDKPVDTAKDAGVGALAGAAVGAAAGAIADGGKGAGKGAAIGGLVGAGGGTLYGLNENKKHDEQYRAAYASCMRARGYTG